MASETRSRRANTDAAFTLVELLLTVALVLMFAGAVILSFGSLDNNARLDEGASHLETLFRYCRAQAANTGRQVRMVFGSGSAPPDVGSMASSTNAPPSLASTTTGVQVLWEPDPVEAPGAFVSLPGAELLVEQVNDLVKVREVGAPGTVPSEAAGLALAAPQTLSLEANTNAIPSGDAGTNSIPLLTCYPDGSSDSLAVVLAAANGDDKRLAVVTLWGVTGATRHRLIIPAADGAWESDDVAEAEPGQDR
jgi:type II secretory pathway pseudopilin PulG